MRLDGTGRTILRVSYGRFNQGILTGELDPIGDYPTTTMAWDAATGGYTTLVSVVDPKKNLALDPQTISPHSDEFSLASTARSRRKCLQVTSNAAASEPQFSTIARPGFLTFGQDPNDLTNATGRLPNDRPHIVRATGVVHLPWQDILIAGNLQCFSGKPWAATAQVGLPQGTQRIMLETRGPRRLPSQSLLDVRVAKTFTVGDATRIEVMLDALNLLNDTAYEAIASDNLFSQTFGRATQFMDPRRVMLGVRLNLGR
jgi:hypothetical protein